MFKAYGYQGAIAALLITQLLMNVLYHYWLGKAGFPIDVKPVLIICAVCIISVILTYALGNHFFLSLFIFPVFIIACIWALPTLKKDLFGFLEKAILFAQNKTSDKRTRKA